MIYSTTARKNIRQDKNLKQALTRQAEARKDSSTEEAGLVYKKKGIYILLSLIVLLLFYVYHDFIFFRNLFIYKGIGSDTYNQFYPSLVHFTNYLRTEGIPKWSFNQGMGQNVFPGGINDPFNLLLYLFDGNHLVYGLIFVQLLKIILGGIIFYYYLKTIGMTPFACIAGALLFSFSGYLILGGGWYGHGTLVVYGAFLLFAFEKLYRQNTWIYFPLAIALLSSQVFTLYMFSIFLLLYSLFKYYLRNDFKSTGIYKLLIKMAGLGILGIGINAVFFISPLLQMINSPRVGGEAGYFYALKTAPVFSFATSMEYMTAIMRTFSNDLMQTGYNFKGWNNYLEAPVFYVGLIVLLLIPQIFQFLDKKRKIIFVAFLGFWSLIIFFPYFRHALYLFSGDYYKSGMSFFIPAITLFTGVAALSGIDRYQKINIKILAATLIFLIILLFFPYMPSAADLINTQLRSVIVVLLFLYAILIWLLNNKQWKTFAQYGILALIVIELGYFSSITVNKRMIETSEDYKDKTGYNDYTVDAVNYLKSTDKSFYRINKDYSSGNAKFTSFNDAMIQDYYGTPSYQSFNQLYYIKFLSAAGILDPNNELQTRWATGLVNKHKLQTFANIKYTLSKNIDTTLVQQGNDSIATFGDVTVFKNRFYLPFGYTYDTYIYGEDFKNTTRKGRTILHSFIINKNQKDLFRDFIYDNTVDTVPKILPLDEYEKLVSALRKDTLAVTEHSQNFFKGKIHLDKTKLLFFSIPYDEGWKAKVDGKDAKPELVNIGFMGLILGKGDHEVTLQFEPPYVKPSLAVSGISLAAYGCLVFIFFRRKKKIRYAT